MAQEYTRHGMAKSTKDNGQMTCALDLVSLLIKIWRAIKGISKTIKDTVKGF